MPVLRWITRISLVLTMPLVLDGNLGTRCLTSDLLFVGQLNCFQNFRLLRTEQKFNVGHNAMTADHAWKVFDLREKVNLIIERHDFVVLRTGSIRVSFDFLSPRD